MYSDISFFKEKTEYEMRISEWSSDVCSSGLDRDVAVRKIARPIRRAAVAEAQIDADLDLLALEVRGDGGFVIAFDRKAVFGHQRIAETDRELVAFGGLACLADRHDDAAPIGVLPRDRGFHPRRIGDAARDAVCALFRGGARHLDGDESDRTCV